MNKRQRQFGMYVMTAMMVISAVMMSYRPETIKANTGKETKSETVVEPKEKVAKQVSYAPMVSTISPDIETAIRDTIEKSNAVAIAIASDENNKSEMTETKLIETAKPVAEEVTVYQPEFRYNPTEQELTMMTAVVSSETGYCEDQAQKAVAHTILNRLASDAFPNDMYSVLTQENQYTAVECYFTGNYREGLYPGSDGWNHTMQLCREACNEWDFTNGAVAYYNPDIIGYNDWFESLVLTYSDQYGRFFKLP